MLRIYVPDYMMHEGKYVINIILKDFLGLNFKIETCRSDNIIITKYAKSKKIEINNNFFIKAKKNFLKSKLIPIAHMKTWVPSYDGIMTNLTEPSIPVLFGSPGIVEDEGHLTLNLDIFGSVFFMLTRYEELFVKERDQHDRFSAHLSHAYKNNYLNRPLVDEYVEILKQCMKMLWPDLKFKERQFCIHVSHDVDQVSRYQTRSNVYQYLRAIGGDLSRGYIKDLMYSPISYFHNQENISTSDPYNTFDWLMNISDDNNLKSTFNFICGKSSKYNADYDIEDNKIKNLIRQIHERGHSIGLHPSYDCYQNFNLIKQELDHLKNVLQSLNINQDHLTSRMHYLRWKTPDTLNHLNNVGLKKDTTLGYADHIGFRCGTCHSYRGYDLINKKPLDIQIEPLIVMDCTLFDYMKLDYDQAYDVAINLKRKCQKTKGQFTILWHNSYLQDPQQKEFYQSLIQN